jgi:hypothetical protein
VIRPYFAATPRRALGRPSGAAGSRGDRSHFSMETIRNFVLPGRSTRGISARLTAAGFSANTFPFDVDRSIHSERDMP